MQKAKAYSVVGTNIESLGSDLNRECKKTASLTEKAWTATGKGPELHVWRIENFKVVPWPKDKYGSFYEGDSYIVLNSWGDPKRLNMDLHFWLGTETSVDEAGTAVYKTIELDDYHNDRPVQHREVQGHESAKFLKYWSEKGGIRILKGGIDSAFNHVEPEKYRPRLLHIKGRVNNTRVFEVPLSHKSLNSGDVFILDNGLTLYQWQGKKSAAAERVKAGQLARAIDDERKGLPEVVVIDEGNANTNSETFWKLMGGKGPIASAEEGGSDRDVGKTAPVKKLFQLSDASGKMVFKEVASGKIPKSALNSDDVFVFDIGPEVFVWIGKGANKAERAKGLEYANQYLKTNNRPDYLPISKIMEGGENEIWESSFDVLDG
jgi:gelsolin